MKNIMVVRTKMSNKYNAQKAIVNGKTFDSKHEGERYYELMIMQRAGAIKDLQLQVPFILIPPQYEEDIELPNGKIKKGKCIEQSVKYIADFVYKDAKTGKTVVEDAKGYKDGAAYRIFVIKRKLMLERFGIRIKEI